MALEAYHILVSIPDRVLKQGETMHCAPIVVVGPCHIGRFHFILQNRTETQCHSSYAGWKKQPKCCACTSQMESMQDRREDAQEIDLEGCDRVWSDARVISSDEGINTQGVACRGSKQL